MYIPDIVREKARDFEEKDLQDYFVRVQNLLAGMKPGDQLIIGNIAKASNFELFLECCKFYMRQYEWQDGLSFGRGFKTLTKYDLAFIKGKKSKYENVTP
ncbi:MAG TPA: hypothetical protein PL124_05450 [Candidatus Cloacimonadota bacterium]|nr:hypothetical protein [Candidatus Cloacimonadota bacterium]HPS38842.1 hypothetical protein [Candidatus Cloacimonadota bacterium]